MKTGVLILLPKHGYRVGDPRVWAALPIRACICENSWGMYLFRAIPAISTTPVVTANISRYSTVFWPFRHLNILFIYSFLTDVISRKPALHFKIPAKVEFPRFGVVQQHFRRSFYQYPALVYEVRTIRY